MLPAIPALLVEILQSIEADHPSSNFMIERYCVRSSSSGRAYFVKLGEPEEEEQYNGEAISIQHITRAAPGLCPTVLHFGIAKFPDIEDKKDAEIVDRPFWVSEYKFMHPLDTKSASVLATRLALELHAHRSQNGACDGETSANPCRTFGREIYGHLVTSTDQAS
jgi:protein-ribulosamine 3-kinase